MSDSIRTFIAIGLSEEIRSELSEVLRRLKTGDRAVRWVKPENIHLTMKFLGNVEPEKLETVKTALSRAAGENASFTLSLGSLGAFPNTRSPRVIWIGMEDGKIEAGKLAARIDDLLAELGFAKEERPFQPHLTLARLKFPPEEKLKNLLDKFTCQFQNKMIVNHVTLYKSTLTSTGPIYEALFQAPLVKTG